MKISDISVNNQYKYNKNANYQCHSPSFGSMGFTFETYRDCFGITRETQNTTGKRSDVSLDELANIIKWRFKKFDRVNILPMNVSDGTEAYFLANALIRNEGLETFEKKYSPIKASDVTKNVIDNYAKNGLLQLYDNEIIEFNQLGMDDILKEVNKDDYKELMISQVGAPDKLFKLSDEYRKHFDFHVEDLQSRILDLKDEGNSVIGIRNCLKQSFGGTESSILILKLANRMRGASLLITGDYDRTLPLLGATLNACFVELKHNIWGLKEYGYIKNYLTKLHA